MGFRTGGGGSEIKLKGEGLHIGDLSLPRGHWFEGECRKSAYGHKRNWCSTVLATLHHFLPG